MTDYVQCELDNCGAVATLFSLFGSTPVPDAHLPLLQNERWVGTGIEREINRIGRRLPRRVSATFCGSGHSVTTLSCPNGCTLQQLLFDEWVAHSRRERDRASREASRRLTWEEIATIAEGVMLQLIGELLAPQNRRCVIISGGLLAASMWHWQTFYRRGSTTAVHNGRAGWHPNLVDGWGPGVVFVNGPLIT